MQNYNSKFKIVQSSSRTTVRDPILFSNSGRYGIPRPAQTGLGMTFLAISIFYFLFSIFYTLPAFAQEDLKLHCFKQDECKASPYNGTLSEPAPECQADAKASSEGRFYYCYAPPPKVCQPGSADTNCAVKLQVSIGGKEIPGLEGYIAALYQYFIAISGILAGIMIVWAGVKWLMAAGNTEMISDAKHKIGGAIIGIILVVISYILLQTINPALVTLKLPSIKLSRRLEVMSSGFCTVQSGIKCNVKVKDCGQNPEACGGSAVGSCIGQVCDTQAETCAKVLPEKNLTTYNIFPKKGETEYSCINPQTQCKDCSNITISPFECIIGAGGGSVTNCWNAETCMSAACHCVVMAGVDEKGKPTKPVCRPTKKTDASCTSGAECESGICNQDDNECVPVGGEPGGTDCTNNKECASGICNTEADPDECTPVDGYQQNDATCEPDSKDIGGASVNAQCGPPGSGWKCIDRSDWIPGEADGVCTNGELGAPCITDQDCKGGTCDNNWAKADGKCK